MKRVAPLRTVMAGFVVLGVAVAWYLFRPERAFIDRRADDPAPGAVTAVLLTGQFEPRAHEGRGRAEILEVGSGHRILRLSSLETSDGPDLEVYLLVSADAARRQDLERGYLSVGPLKGNLGSQNYSIPEGADLARYHAVAVWCRRFSVNFTTARMTPIAAEDHR